MSMGGPINKPQSNNLAYGTMNGENGYGVVQPPPPHAPYVQNQQPQSAPQVTANHYQPNYYSNQPPTSGAISQSGNSAFQPYGQPQYVNQQGTPQHYQANATSNHVNKPAQTPIQSPVQSPVHSPPTGYQPNGPQAPGNHHQGSNHVSHQQSTQPPPYQSYGQQYAQPPQQQVNNIQYSTNKFQPNPPQSTQPLNYQPYAQNAYGARTNAAPPVNDVANRMSGMSLNSSWSQMWGQDAINLMSEKNIRSKIRETPPACVTSIIEGNCSRDIMRSTITKIPETASLLQKSRLPLGILIHPFKDADEDEIPVISDSPIVRCRACRTYLNPFVRLLDSRRWQCNLCHRVNDFPEELLYAAASGSDAISSRPDLSCGSVEYVASVEYMVRPPQPACYLFLFDCSRYAYALNYIQSFAQALLDSIEELPGDSRTLIGFMAFDSRVHFFTFNDRQMVHMIAPDITDIFIPSPDSVLVSLQEHHELIEEFIRETLPNLLVSDGPIVDTGSALGPALQAAYKCIASTGGRITVIQATLPNAGPNDGSVLTNREDPNSRSSATNLTPLLNPATDFYKKLALECSEHQVAVDLFDLSPTFSDLASVGSISKFSGGSVYYYGTLSTGSNVSQPSINIARFEEDMRHYLTRNIGFEAVMRMRCTRGLSIHTFHGNFFVRSTDLLALPNVNPDSGYAMQISIDDDLKDQSQACFQAAVLYTSACGERRIRVHTLVLPIASTLPDVINACDEEAVIGLLSKMAVDRSLGSSLSDAREALINAIVDLLQVYKNVNPSQACAGLVAPNSAALLPLHINALLKHVAFRIGVSTKMDERVNAMQRMKTLPLAQLMIYIYPNLYPVHNLVNDLETLPIPLSFGHIERNGVYLLDTFDHLFLYICKSVHPQWLMDVFGTAQWNQIPDDGDQVPNAAPSIQSPSGEAPPLIPLPELENDTSKRLRDFIDGLICERFTKPQFHILREDSRQRFIFLQYLYEDRNESALSYYEFLQYIQQQLKN